MLRKFSPSGAILILMLISGLTSCTNEYKGDVPSQGGITFDTSKAARYVIPIKDAISFQRSFVATRGELAKKVSDTFLARNFNLPNSESFSKDALLLLLSQKGADGVRFYYGKDGKGGIRLVLLPVNKDGKDIYTKFITSSTGPKPASDTTAAKMSQAAGAVESDADAVETGQTCPPCLIDPAQQN